jgi:glutamate-5-semialdehyde dehydrogenase
MTESVQSYMRDVGQAARQASRSAARATTAQKNAVLNSIAKAIEDSRETLKTANQLDLAQAQKNQRDPAFVDRLTLGDKAINSMLAGLRQIVELPDPVGTIGPLKRLPSGIQVGHMQVPLGVIGIIYESRPNVTIDAAGLCLKAGNATILRGGSDALHSNTALAHCIASALREHGLPETIVQVVNTADRSAVTELITHPEYVDVIIPRGGKSLIERISAEARVPVIKHLDGICHTYVDSPCNVEMAVTVAYNAKAQRYGTCNTMESLLLHSDVAQSVLQKLAPLYSAKGIELRADREAAQLLGSLGQAFTVASDIDFRTEFLGPVLAVKVVHSLDQAIAHINDHSSAHTDAIITQNHEHAMRFLHEVDSASVMVNASTRFADGFEYGLGAEIGISTDRLHARGPVGLDGLTTYKWVVLGHGEIRN